MRPPQVASVGTWLRDKWYLTRVVGAGGMATVFEGRHRNGQRVAVKVLHPRAAASRSTRERFRSEAYIANQIAHPGAVEILYDDEADGYVYLVMELLEGQTLERLLKREGKLTIGEALNLIDRLLDVLTAAHTQGVVHRDIKPDNLFLTTSGELKVLDFGVAKVRLQSADETAAGVTLGTPGFLSPEQAFGYSGEADGRTDIWAVGATLFTLLTGELVQDLAGETLMSAAVKPARRLDTLYPAADRELVALVDRALRFDKSERWPSASRMREAVRAVRDHLAQGMLGRTLDGATTTRPITLRPPPSDGPTDEIPTAIFHIDEAGDPAPGPGPQSRRAQASYQSIDDSDLELGKTDFFPAVTPADGEGRPSAAARVAVPGKIPSPVPASSIPDDGTGAGARRPDPGPPPVPPWFRQAVVLLIGVIGLLLGFAVALLAMRSLSRSSAPPAASAEGPIFDKCKDCD